MDAHCRPSRQGARCDSQCQRAEPVLAMGGTQSGYDSTDEAGTRYGAARHRHGKTRMGLGAGPGLQQPGRYRGSGGNGQPEAARSAGERKMIRSRVALLFLLPAVAGAQVNVETVLDRVRSGVKPGEAMAYMRQTYSTDRWFTSPKFQETAEYLKQAMTAGGLQNVELLSAPADGVTQAGYWTEPLAWDVKQARLELVGDVPAEFRVLADFEKVPTSLGMWSGATPAGGVTAQIVEWNERSDMRGKLVLTKQNPANIKWRLVKKGVLGAINT